MMDDLLYKEATGDCARVNLADRSYFEIKGVDSRKLLNGVLTNDIKKLEGKTGCYSLLLTPKGKIVADLFCYTCGDHFGIDCDTSLKERLLENLKRYIIFQKVEIEDPGEKWGAIAVVGPKSEVVLNRFMGDLPVGEYAYDEKNWEGNPVWVICKTRWGLPSYELWMQREALAAVEAKLGMPELDEATREILRIESLTPRFGFDMNENTLPQEAGLQNALSFTKGCYVGQEIVARLEHRGHAGKRLVQLQLQGDVSLSKGDKICNSEGQEIGEITSSCFSPKFQSALALGYIRYNFLNLPQVFVNQVPALVTSGATPR